MTNVTHVRDSSCWTRCGMSTDGVEIAVDVPPTCLWCAANRPLHIGWYDPISRIIEENSVKELQELEDKKFIEAVDAEIASRRGA